MHELYDFRAKHLLLSGEVPAICPGLLERLRSSGASISILPNLPAAETSAKALAEAVAAAVMEYGKLAGLVVAQVPRQPNPLKSFDMQLERDNWQTGYWNIVRILQPAMKAKNAAPSLSAVILSSDPVLAALTRCAAAECAPKGQRVNMVAPGKDAAKQVMFLLSSVASWMTGRCMP